MSVLSSVESGAGVTDIVPAQSSTDTSVAAVSSQAAISSTSPDTSSSALSSSDTSTTSASATASISATSTSATSSTTASTSTSSTTSSSSSSSTTTEAGTTSPGINTQTLTSTHLFTSDTPSSSASAATSSGTPFFQNKGAVAGVFTVIGLVAAITLVYLITRVLRRRRQRQLDREMDAVSFVPASLQAIVDDDDDAGPRHLPSLDLSSGSHGAQSGYSGYSGASYSQPPLPLPQQQHNYGFAQRDYASSEYSNAGAAGVGAARGLPPALMREPQMVQPQRAMVRQSQPVQADTGLAHKTSQSATVYNTAEPSGPLSTGDYLSNYSSPPASGESEYLSPTTEIPLSPPLPNPYGGDEKPQRVLKVANE